MEAEQIMETFGLLATFMNHDGAWITGREREERTHKSQHPVQAAGLSYQEKRDMIILNTHFLPVYEREKRRCHHRAGCL